MEGIRDGAAVDDCYHCALLYPGRLEMECPRCGGRMRYEPASRNDAISVEALVQAHVAAYAGSRSSSALEVLLVTLHRFGDAGAQALDAAGISMAQLREAYESFGGSSKRHMYQLATER